MPHTNKNHLYKKGLRASIFKFLEPNSKKIILSGFLSVFIFFLFFFVIALRAILENTSLVPIVDKYIYLYLAAGIYLLAESIENPFLLYFIEIIIFVWAYFVACLSLYIKKFISRKMFFFVLPLLILFLAVSTNPIILYGFGLESGVISSPFAEEEAIVEKIAKKEETFAKELIKNDIIVPPNAVTPPTYRRGFMITPETWIFKKWQDENFTYEISLFPSSYSFEVCAEGNVSLDELKENVKKYLKNSEIIELLANISEENRHILKTLTYNILNNTTERKIFITLHYPCIVISN